MSHGAIDKSREHIEALRMELVGMDPDSPPVEAGLTVVHARKWVASINGMVPPGNDSERKGIIRGFFQSACESNLEGNVTCQ